MEYLVTQAQMKQYDKNTIEYLKIPSAVLMERAALVTVEELLKEKGNAPQKALIVAGCGNNGGDGLAIGRLLMRRGFPVDVVLLGSPAKCSGETRLQTEILARYGVRLYDTIPEREYDIVIDAIFGIGLTREIEGIYKDAIEAINGMKAYVCSVDIPSGIHADSGKILGCAVKADMTVTYGFYKLGEFLYPGTEYCGKIICRQMGIDEYSFLGKKPVWYTYTGKNDVILPKRKANGNKGTFGKTLIIAGSDNICGAALMAGKSVFRMGAGMVRIVTSCQNREVIQQALPEAMVTVYDTTLWQADTPDAAFISAFLEAHEWADCILIGPGIGTGQEAQWMLRYCLNESTLPMVVDADGLNLIAAGRVDMAAHKENVILTPHLLEFARLAGCSVKEVSENITVYPKKLSEKMHCIVVCKDARTVVAAPENEMLYLNTSGNAGMATAGAGDVLAGMIAGLLSQGMDAEKAAVTGVYLHGLAGDMAADAHGEYSMMATDIIEELEELLKTC